MTHITKVNGSLNVSLRHWPSGVVLAHLLLDRLIGWQGALRLPRALEAAAAHDCGASPEQQDYARPRTSEAASARRLHGLAENLRSGVPWS